MSCIFESALILVQNLTHVPTSLQLELRLDLPATLKTEGSPSPEHVQTGRTDLDVNNSRVESNRDSKPTLMERLKRTEEELQHAHAHNRELEKELRTHKDVLNRLGVICTSVSRGDFAAEGVLDRLNEHLIHEWREETPS